MEEIISTAQLIIRKPVIDDYTDVFRNWAQDHEVTRYLSWKPHTSSEETRSFILQCIKDWESGSRFALMICLKATEEVIGMIEYRVDLFKAETGYVLNKKHWGFGYMSEALFVLINQLLAQENIYRVQAFCDVDNAGSFRVMEKAGMKCEGLLSRFAIHPNISDKPRDCYMFSKTK
jgi:[ribosomal protein S5]-alanine N-acetyltransferase